MKELGLFMCPYEINCTIQFLSFFSGFNHPVLKMSARKILQWGIQTERYLLVCSVSNTYTQWLKKSRKSSWSKHKYEEDSSANGATEATCETYHS